MSFTILVSPQITTSVVSHILLAPIFDGSQAH
jgi:hypothetical protein